MMDKPPSPNPNWFMSLIQGTTAVPKSVAKLLDTVCEQIGLFLEPIHIRRKGQAESDLSLAEAKAKAAIAVVRIENKDAIQDFEDRIEERLRRREAKRQATREAITAQAVQEIPESVSEQPVDEDWTARFFESCEDVNDEQMRLLWARILAGEVAKPGSFSLRTLAFTRTLSKKDAELFTRFCSLLWQTVMTGPTGSAELVFRPLILDLDKVQSIPEIQLQFEDFVRLDSLGLIRFEAIGGFSINYQVNTPYGESQLPPNIQLVWYYYGGAHTFTKSYVDQPGQIIKFEAGKAMLTDIGHEMAPIAGSKPNETYRQLILSELRQRDWKVLES